MRCRLLTAFLLSLTTAVAIAQSTGSAATAAPSVPHSRQISEWPDPGNRASYGTLDLVTTTKPAVRNKCRVHIVASDTITCGAGIGRKPVIYQRDIVAALIAPPFHGDRNKSILILGVTAAALAASFFVPLAWAISLRVLPITVWSFTVFSDVSTDGRDTFDDHLLYQRPNTTLTIHLH